MLKNFFITALRNFRKNPTYTVINLVGLSLGIACCLAVYTIIEHEYSFDEWHDSKDNIYRLTTVSQQDHETVYSGLVPYPYGQAVKENIAEVKDVIEFHGPNDDLLSFVKSDNKHQIFREKDVLFTNSAFLKYLDFRIIKGNAKDLDQPDKIFLTESLAKKYFQKENPIGKTIYYDKKRPLEVAGIVEDSPNNTSLPFDCLISIETMRIIQPRVWQLWKMTWEYSSYLVLNENANVEQLNKKIDEVIDSYTWPDNPEKQAKTAIRLQPLEEIHEDDRYGYGNYYVAPQLLLYSFFFLGLLILVTSCLNFINLSTAQAINRSKEVGIRKTLGSTKSQLVIQFFLETLIIVIVANLFAFSIGQMLLDGFNQSITLVNFNLSFTGKTIGFSIGLSLLVTILTGAYPSMVLAGYQPVQALKNKITLYKGSGSFNLRRTLIIAQFTFTCILIISSLIIFSQVSYMKKKDLGFNPKDVMLIQTPEGSENSPSDFMANLKKRSYVLDATLAYRPPLSSDNWNYRYRAPGGEIEDGKRANTKFIDENYIDFYEIELIAGSNIPGEKDNDSTYQVLVNQQLIQSMGWKVPEEALGKRLIVNEDIWKIRGVYKDFNYFTPHTKIGPSALIPQPRMTNQIALKIKPEHQLQAISDIEAVFKGFYPNHLLEIDFLDDQIEDEYILENLIIRVVSFISILAILLSVVGLYGLVAFMANRSAKMIGIRKVFGASVANILGIFTKEYLRMLIISFLIGMPIAYYLMDSWIKDFAYRIDLTAIYFIAGFFITGIITVATVGYRSFIAAKANPAKSLRYE